jgi:hypothetical protein
MTSYVIFIAESPSSWDGCIPAKTSHHFGTSWRKAPPSPRFGSITGGFTWIEARDAFDEISIIYGGGKVGRMLFGEWEMTWMDYMIDRCFVHVIGILLHAWSCVRKSDRITVHEKTTYIYTHIHTYIHAYIHTYMQYNTRQDKTRQYNTYTHTPAHVHTNITIQYKYIYIYKYKYNTIQYNTIYIYNTHTIQYNTVHYTTIQYSTIQTHTHRHTYHTIP